MNINPTIANIIVSINNSNVDKPFSYLIPEELVSSAIPGMRVVVPFGRSNKPVEGFIIDVVEKKDSYGGENDVDSFTGLKSIIRFPDKSPLCGEDLMQLARWMQDKYYSTLSECIKCILPTGISIKTETVYYLNPTIDAQLSETEEKIIDYAMKYAPVKKQDLLSINGASSKNVDSLIRKGILTKENLTSNKDFILYERQVTLTANLESIKMPSEKTKQGQLINYLRENGSTGIKKIKEDLKVTDSPIKSLVNKGIAVYVNVEIRRESSLGERFQEAIGSSALTLTKEQTEALKIIDETALQAPKKPILLQGVTGSGKTEVYLKAIEEMLKKGKDAIVLVPEISLTPQTVGRFKSRFGEKVGVTHSRMSMAERYDMWKNAYEGQISIMIGPRSALFAPFRNLGIIIIDEEHEHTYKSDTTPKYDARAAAIERARITGSIVVMGSATPSIASYHKALSGNYILSKMKNRVNMSMPDIDIIDMRQELENGNRSMFSTELAEAITDNISKNMQTILFLNRRGHSTFVSCRACGYVVKCDLCSINFTYHNYDNSLICHYCAARAKASANCPQCGSKYIRYFGVGTQKVEDELIKMFPGISVLRMDMDTTKGKGAHERILSAFKNGKAQVLVGTQMIAKGLDFPKVTLVGVVAGDLSLHTGDFRAAENTFQLLTQVSGRSGRADYSGRVIIQTYNPEHYALHHVKTGDYEGFYEQEIALRRQMDYPPFTHIFEILVTGESEKKLILVLQRLCDILSKYNKDDEFELIGPAPAIISKIRNRYRWRLSVKAADEERLKKYVLYCIKELEKAENLSDINISLTIDPATSS